MLGEALSSRNGSTKWDFGNVKKDSRDPTHDPAPCNAPNLENFQINIPIGEVFWDPTFPIPPEYAPIIPPCDHRLQFYY